MQINSVNSPAEIGPPNPQPGDPAHRVLNDAKAAEGKRSTESKREVARNTDFERLEQTLSEHNISMRFSRDGSTKQLVLNLIDENTGESVLQLPSPVTLKLAAEFVRTQGQFVDKTE